MKKDSSHDVLYVEPSELSAMLVAVDIFLRVVQQCIEPSVNREIVLTYLRSFNLRCRGIVRQVAAGKEQRALIPVMCSGFEMIAFATAVEMYIHLDKTGLISYLSLDVSTHVKEEINIVGRLISVQRRYLLSSSPVPLSDE